MQPQIKTGDRILMNEKDVILVVVSVEEGFVETTIKKSPNKGMFGSKITVPLFNLLHVGYYADGSNRWSVED